MTEPTRDANGYVVCWHPHYAHTTCRCGAPIHLDPDNYEDVQWVHCRIVDVLACPFSTEDMTGAALAGRHRK